MCERKMDAAANLIGALSGEETRWMGQSAEFDDTIQRLSGDCALASAFVSYLGPFNREFRDLLLKKEFLSDCKGRGIPASDKVTAALLCLSSMRCTTALPQSRRDDRWPPNCR